MNVVAGIDYSMTCPCVCIRNYDGTVDFHYTIDNLKLQDSFTVKDFTFTGYPYPTYKDNIERFAKLSDLFLRIFQERKVKTAAMEGYAYSRRGQVFDIGENGGILKYRMRQRQIELTVLGPTQIKKFAFGKGNADKFQMYEAWEKKFPKVDLYQVFSLKRSESKVPSPIQDIVDAYFTSELLLNTPH